MKPRNPWLMTGMIGVLLIGGHFSSYGALSVYDPFSYATGSLAGDTDAGSPDIGFSGAWGAVTGGTISVTSPGQTWPGLTTVGNAVTITPSGTTTEYRGLASTYSTGTVYLSFMAQNTNGGTRFFGLSLFNTVGGSEQLFIGQASAASVWSIGEGAAVASSTISTSTLSLLVLRIDFNSAGNETLSLYVNPTSSTEPTTADAVLSSINIASFGAFRIGAGDTSGATTKTTGILDEIKLGTTFADVANIVAVPEPPAITLTLVGLLMLAGTCFFRKRVALKRA